MLKVKERDGRFYIVGRLLGKRVNKSTGLQARRSNLPAAKSVLEKTEREVIEAAAGKTKVSRTFNDAANSYLAKLGSEGRDHTETIRRVHKLQLHYKDKRCHEITAATVAEATGRLWPGCKPGTIARGLTDLRAILNREVRLGHLEAAPHIEMPKADNARDEHLGLLEIEDLYRWLAEKHPDYLLAFMVLTDAGLRLSEALRLEWRNVEYDRIFVGRMVNGKPRTRLVPTTKRLRAKITRGWVGKGPSDHVFLTPTGKPFNAKWGSVFFGRLLDAFCKEHGITRNITVHDLRHTFAYQMGHYGIDLGDLQKLMGHENISMTMRYRGFIRSRAESVISDIGDGPRASAASSRTYRTAASDVSPDCHQVGDPNGIRTRVAALKERKA